MVPGADLDTGAGKGPAAACLTQGRSQDSPIVFLMESNPRGLYIFPLILGILFLFLRT